MVAAIVQLLYVKCFDGFLLAPALSLLVRGVWAAEPAAHSCEGSKLGLALGLVFNILCAGLNVLCDLELVVLAGDVRLKVAQIVLDVRGVLVVIKELVEIDETVGNCFVPMQSVVTLMMADLSVGCG